MSEWNRLWMHFTPTKYKTKCSRLTHSCRCMDTHRWKLSIGNIWGQRISYLDFGCVFLRLMFILYTKKFKLIWCHWHGDTKYRSTGNFRVSCNLSNHINGAIYFIITGTNQKITNACYNRATFTYDECSNHITMISYHQLDNEQFQ